MMILERLLLRKTVAVVLVAAGAVFIVPSVAYADLTEISPNPSDMLANGHQGGMAHVLKHEGVATTSELRLAAYYPRSTGGDGQGRTIKIRFSALDGRLRTDISHRRCWVKPADIPNFGRRYVRVTVGSRQYTMSLSKVCTAFSGRDNVIGNNPNNAFFANYALPRDMGDVDSQTQLYKVPITIQYLCDMAAGPRENLMPIESDSQSPDYTGGICPASGSDKNSFNFVVAADRSNVIVGALKNTITRGYGLRSIFFKPENNPSAAPRAGVEFALQFGVPCTLEDGSISPPKPRRLRLYDADIRGFGPTYIWLSDDGNAIGSSRYATLLRNNGNWDGNDPASYNHRGSLDWHTGTPSNPRRFEIIERGSGINAGFVINDLTYSHNYRLVIHNPVNNTREDGRYEYGSPVNNVFAMEVPEDAIFGQIACDYVLTPEPPAHDPIYSRGGDISVTSSITQNNDAASGDHSWQTYVVRYTSSQARIIDIDPRDVDEDDESNPCAVVSAANRTVCRRIFTKSYPLESQRTDVYGTSGEAGDYICFFTRIKKPTEALRHNDVWRYSDMVCSRPGEKPKVQIWGNDVRSAGKLDTSLSIFRGTTYGSWSEYGAFSTGQNINFATGSTLERGGSSDPASNNPLTFANTGLDPGSCATGYGCYGTINPPTSLINKLQALCAGNWLSGDLTTVSSWAEHGNIVCSTGTVTVSGNINNPTGINNLQQKIIIARDIVINDNVKNIDAWLVALPNPHNVLTPWGDGTSSFGRINTCRGATRQADGLTGLLDPTFNRLKTGRCAKQLTINGPVISDKLYLTRTHGGDKDNAEVPAEIINLRADAFVWAFNGTSGGSNPVAQTISVRELPPRF